MELLNLLTIAAALAAPAVAQISALPNCALQPALAAVGQTGCAATDVGCICRNQAFIQSLAPAIQAACSPSDLQQAFVAAQNLCASAGVTLNLPAPTASGSASAPASMSMSMSMSMSSTAMMSSTPASAVASPSMSSTTMAAMTTSMSSMAPANATTTVKPAGNATTTGAGATSVQPYTGAAAPTAVWEIAIGVVAAGAGVAFGLF